MLVVLSRSMEAETLAAAQLRVEDAAERAQLAALAAALERRDLTVGSGAADGAAAILRTGIGQVASLVETIQSTALEISATSQQVSAASVESARSSEEIAGAVNMVASVTEQQARLVAGGRRGRGRGRPRPSSARWRPPRPPPRPPPPR